MATKKEQARTELMKLPQVATSLVDTGIGNQWSRSIECCRVNGEIYMKPTWDMFDSVKITKYVKSGDFSECEALPLRTGSGPFTWMLQVKAVKRLQNILIYEVRHETEQKVFVQKIEALLSYQGELENLTLTDEQIHEAHQHVSNRNRLLQESKQEQNDRIASVVGRANGEPLDKYGYELSNGTLKKLERAGITTVEQLLAWSLLDLLKIGGFGRKALTEVDDMMEAHGWKFGCGKPSDDSSGEKPLTVTLTHKPGDMITWREWTKDGGFGKEHQTKVEEVMANVYWDETRQQYITTEKYSTSIIADGKRVSVTVDLMGDGILIGCLKNLKKRFFREHRGGFTESMKTMRKVDGVKDIQDYLNSVYPEGYLKNIRIAADTKRDHRLHLDEWGHDTYMVVADFDGYTGQCVGFANFWEE